MCEAKENPEAVRLYTMAVEQADRVSSRRGQANQFYLGIETLILGVPTIFAGTTDGDPLRTSVLSLVGAIVSATWWLQLRSYRQLNEAKFQVITEIELNHFSIRPFHDEYKPLVAGEPVKWWKPRYAELGTVERIVPVVFLGANVVLGIWAWF